MTLPCSREDDSKNRFQWYKQTLGGKLRLMSSFYKHHTNVEFKEEFRSDIRLSANITGRNYHLTIGNLSFTDSATYYCTSSYVYTFQLDKIYIVHVTSLHLNRPVEVHRLPSESRQSGESGILNCTVHTGTCDEELSVYWFRTSGASEPELIYAHRARNDHCKGKNNICFYNLSIKNLTSKAGTYYCAVRLCGRILFGGGNKLENESKQSADYLVYFLTGALVFSTILCVLLASFLFKLHKREQLPASRYIFVLQSAISAATDQYQSTDIQTDPSLEMSEMIQEDNVHYAALKNHKVHKSRRKRESSGNNCVYSSVVTLQVS
uniref:Ig-like domain-containing protein n=1 Tax=Tetraodon nigroviridis TaxID=99883 RepID=H3DNR2_TETNG